MPEIRNIRPEVFNKCVVTKMIIKRTFLWVNSRYFTETYWVYHAWDSPIRNLRCLGFLPFFVYEAFSLLARDNSRTAPLLL